MNNEENQIVRLPLWRNCIDEMRKSGLNYGQVFEAEFFEKHLRCPRDEMRHGLAISEIRRELEKDGFYLSGRGCNGHQYVILPPQGNADILLHYSRKAADALRRGVILGTNTRLDTLSQSERRRHEAILERMAIKSVLLSRSKQVTKILSEVPSKLLRDLDSRPIQDCIARYKNGKHMKIPAPYGDPLS